MAWVASLQSKSSWLGQYPIGLFSESGISENHVFGRPTVRYAGLQGDNFKIKFEIVVLRLCRVEKCTWEIDWKNKNAHTLVQDYFEFV